VRPRPPSTGRAATSRSRPAPDRSSQLRTHRRIDRSGPVPIAFRASLALAVVALAVFVAWAATGQVGRAAASVGSLFDGFLHAVTTSPSPPPTEAVLAGAPSLSAPAQADTNEATVTLSGSVPQDVVGKPDFTINLYQALKSQKPARILEGFPVPTTPLFTIRGVKLQKGSNSFTVTLVGPGGESLPSKPVVYVLDQTPPKVTITAPKPDATVNASAATITGKTQARSALLAHNADNMVNVAGTAADDGSFTLKVPLVMGPNGITLTVTDPAGNVTSQVIAIRRGSGKLAVSLKPSDYQINVRVSHSGFTLTATVTDPDGHPLEGASVTFTLSVPGVQPIVGTATTDGTGTATFRTRIPKTQLPAGTRRYTAPATALVSSDDFGTAQTQVPITYYR